MEDHTTTDSTLRIVGLLRQDFPSTGAVLQASLHRTEDDCKFARSAGLAGAPLQGRVSGAGIARVAAA